MMPYRDAKASVIIRRNGRTLVWFATVFGAVIIGSHVDNGQTRWSAPVWAFALEIPGSPATWGAIIALAAALMAWGGRTQNLRLRLAGYWLAFLWFCGLAIAAMAALAADQLDGIPNPVNPMGVVAWVAFASMYCVQLRDEGGLPVRFMERVADRFRWVSRLRRWWHV